MEKEEAMDYTPTTATAHALREELRTSRITFKDSDVIKFTAFGRYRYAAIRAEGKWHFTGGGNTFGQGVTDSKMIEILKDDKQDIMYITAGTGEIIV